MRSDRTNRKASYPRASPRGITARASSSPSTGASAGFPAGKLEGLDLPVAGDWVAVQKLDGERKGIVEAVLPRRTSFTRKEAWRRTVAQVVAANIDTVFLVTAFGQDLNPRRLERYLTARGTAARDRSSS
jgi:putative ribosome biogenesis GTPase RsgA